MAWTHRAFKTSSIATQPIVNWSVWKLEGSDLHSWAIRYGRFNRQVFNSLSHSLYHCTLNWFLALYNKDWYLSKITTLTNIKTIKVSVALQVLQWVHTSYSYFNTFVTRDLPVIHASLNTCNNSLSNVTDNSNKWPTTYMQHSAVVSFDPLSYFIIQTYDQSEHRPLQQVR